MIAGDTLTTVTRTQQKEEEGQPSIRTASSFPASTSATKVFSFLGSFGVGVTGHPYVGGRNVGSIIREASRQLRVDSTKSIEKAARKLGARVRQQMTDPNEHVRLLVCGYDKHEAHSITVVVKSEGVTLPKGQTPPVGPGVTFGGEGHVVKSLWKLATERKTEGAYSFFSLRDAVEHAKFLIRLTEGYQRYFLEPQTVGGMIDVGIIDQLEGFKWIQRASHLVSAK